MLYAFNKGEVCTCPSRALIQESIYDAFMERCLERIERDPAGQPARPGDDDRPAGLPGPAREDRELRQDRARGGRGAALSAASATSLEGEFAGGYYYKPTVLKGDNAMRVFQEEIFGPVLAVTTFKDEAEALRIANDTPYGLGAGVWTRDSGRAFRMGRGIKAGRVWTNCYHLYPAARGVRRLQELGRRPREPPDDARPLQPDEVPAGLLRPEPARLLLMPQRVTATPAALAVVPPPRRPP